MIVFDGTIDLWLINIEEKSMYRFLVKIITWHFSGETLKYVEESMLIKEYNIAFKLSRKSMSNSEMLSFYLYVSYKHKIE